MGKVCEMKKRKWDCIYFDMSLEELMREYEASMGHSPITLELIKGEMWRRDADRINRRIYHLTIVITVLTAVSAFFVVYSIFK